MRFSSKVTAIERLRPPNFGRGQLLFAIANMGNKQSTPVRDDDQFDVESNVVDSGSIMESQFEEPASYPRPLGTRQLQPMQSIERRPLRNADNPQRSNQLSGKIATVSHLLRDMYSLELKIFGTENCRPEDEGERNAMIEQANMLFASVKAILDGWEENREGWTDDELNIIKTIRAAADHHDPRKHRRRRVGTAMGV